jgi:hypothetical protein
LSQPADEKANGIAQVLLRLCIPDPGLGRGQIDAVAGDLGADGFLDAEIGQKGKKNTNVGL